MIDKKKCNYFETCPPQHTSKKALSTHLCTHHRHLSSIAVIDRRERECMQLLPPREHSQFCCLILPATDNCGIIRIRTNELRMIGWMLFKCATWVWNFLFSVKHWIRITDIPRVLKVLSLSDLMVWDDASWLVQILPGFKLFYKNKTLPQRSQNHKYPGPP